MPDQRAPETHGHPILVEGQHPDGRWEEDPPPDYRPIRFSVGGQPLELNHPVEFLVQSCWVTATFEGLSRASCFARLSIPLSYGDEEIESVDVPVSARFRLPESSARAR